MRFLISSVNSISGIAKASNQPFSMQRVTALVPHEDVDTAKFQNHGHGFGSVELTVSNSFYPELERKFSSDFKDLPIYYDFQVSIDNRSNLTLIGFEKIQIPSVELASDSVSSFSTKRA
ncbi:MAG TPA: hypothetical protein DGG95_03220 [Cytophagales bacterium]|jgi:hypothetical protein|nr:hypothetical protein [Cytophagales bacterium]